MKPLAARLGEALGSAYTIEGEIGRGGMGVVYRARDERLKRRVAIKVLPPELAFQEDIRARFTREAETAARLSHPNIVPIHNVGEGAGLVYFVMGYVDGESLGARLKRRGKLPPEEARRIMRETADALSAAHGLSVIHRDIKPDNILLEGTRGRVMVTDFGIAKAMSGTGTGATLTSAGVAIGTPQYMSPEQAAGEKDIDGRSDLYSLGIVSYQMLTGELPFNAPTVAGILMKQITEVAPPVISKRAEVSEDLSLAVSRCLEKDPENRWPSADALRRSLESRTVTGYRPTGATKATSRTNSTTPRTSRGEAPPPRTTPKGAPQNPRLPVPRRPLPGEDWRGQLARHTDRASRRMERKGIEPPPPVPDTGEPKIVQKTRALFARWSVVTGGCFLIWTFSGFGFPWFLFPSAFVGWPLIDSYSKLWQSGYSWRDVLSRPPAADALETRTIKGNAKLPRSVPLPTHDEFGAHQEKILQAHADRAAILKLLERLSPAERKMLDDDVAATVDGLYQRSADLGRTLHSMDTNLDAQGLARIDERVAALQKEPDDEERTRRLGLLERQRKAMIDLNGRKDQVANQMESCILAMQNVRFDLLRLRSADAASAMSDLTHATQQARALSRDVDNAIAAAGEIRDAIS
ncbi:MAG: protein kinase [Gemmatimonadota bacterium]